MFSLLETQNIINYVMHPYIGNLKTIMSKMKQVMQIQNQINISIDTRTQLEDVTNSSKAVS
jgi:hypothetical protein